MTTHDTENGAGLASLVSFDEKDMVAGATMGEWQYPQQGVTATWRLEHHEKRGNPPKRLYAYRVLVTYMESLMLDVRLDGIKDTPTPFSVSDPRKLHPSVSGNVQVKRHHEPGKRAKLELLIELTEGAGKPGKLQSLASCDVPDTPEQPVPGNEPKRVPDEYDARAPYSCVGQLKMVFKHKKSKHTKTYIGTATVIEALNKHDNGLYLLTCAHNLYDPDPAYGKAYSVSFTPGLNGEDQSPRPQSVEAAAWYYPSEYEDVAISRNADLSRLSDDALLFNSELDYGLVKLEKRVKVPKAVPQVKVATDLQLEPAFTKVALCGLYGWNEHDQAKMYSGEGLLSGFTDKLLHYAVSTRPGCSGSAVFLQSLEAMEVIGVHDFGGGPGNRYNIGHRIIDDTVAQLHAWMEQDS
jgi:V8-like Glu-specific endopeptidase